MADDLASLAGRYAQQAGSPLSLLDKMFAPALEGLGSLPRRAANDAVDFGNGVREPYTLTPEDQRGSWAEHLEQRRTIRLPKEMDEPQKWLNDPKYKDMYKDIDRKDQPDGSVILSIMDLIS